MTESIVVMELGVEGLITALVVLFGFNFALLKYFAKREIARIAKLEEELSKLKASVISRPEMDRITKNLTDLVIAKSAEQTNEIRLLREELNRLILSMVKGAI